MDIVEAINKRKSIRSFKPDKVEKNILEKVLKIGARAPSAMNTQTWSFTLLSGDVLENVKRANVEKLLSKTPPKLEVPDVTFPKGSKYRKRQVNLAIQLFQLMDIKREDNEKREDWSKRGFRYFDAPAAIIVSVDRSLPEAPQMLDAGLVMQNICLAALAFDLGTCIENQGIMYPEVLRKFAGIPESKLIISSIAIGYPDWNFAANKIKSERAPLEDITIWCGFE